MKALKVQDLLGNLKSAVLFNKWGDRKIVTPCDEEENGYSTLWSTSLEIGDYFGDPAIYLGWDDSQTKRDNDGFPKPVTVRELLEAVESFANKNHTYKHRIVVPSDDEQNGECLLWYGLTEINDGDHEEYQFHDRHDFDEYKKEWLILG